jgi:hypothetical protein
MILTDGGYVQGKVSTHSLEIQTELMMWRQILSRLRVRIWATTDTSSTQQVDKERERKGVWKYTNGMNEIGMTSRHGWKVS